MGFPYPLGDDFHIRVDENGLNKYLQAQGLHSPEQSGCGDLGVDNAVAVIWPLICLFRAFKGVAGLAERQVADGMNRDIHVGPVGGVDILEQLLFRVNGDAEVIRSVGVSPLHLGRACSQGAVLQQLSGTGAEKAVPVARIAAH